ncbi:MAG: cytochrome c-type biogenesis protein CcmH [Acidimicrobiales bacterium]
MNRHRFPLWTLLGVVLVAALVVGSGALDTSPPTAAQRAAAIESVIRCPSCEDLSVADSSAQTAVTVRATVRQQVGAGRTDQQIEDYLVARYGSSIILDPPASGWTLLVWLLPLLGGLVAVTGVAVVLLRRRTATRADAPGGAPTLGADPSLLEEQRQFLVQSLADADAEYLAGDLSDRDYLALRQRDMVRLSAVESRLDELRGAAPDRPPTRVLVAEGLLSSDADGVAGGPHVLHAREPDAPATVPVAPAAASAADLPAAAARRHQSRSRRSWWFLGGAVAAFAAALVLAVSLLSSTRLPGQSETGSISLSQSQQIEDTLSRAASLENQGQLGQAATLYQSVLDTHPDNEVALAQLGWLEFETGQQGDDASLMSAGRAMLNRAVGLDPTDYAAHLYLGTVLLQQDDNAAGAVAQYGQFLSDDPTATVLQQAAPEVRLAYQQAGVPVPAGVPAG